jgi:glycosyltransferase involved in cell wall biosynthesis
MKILQITSNDARTGGAVAVAKLQDAMRKLGHTSSILTPHKLAESGMIPGVDRSLPWRGADWAARRAGKAIGLPQIYEPSAALLIRAVDRIQPDIVHLHWTYSGGVPLSMLPALSRRYPVAWTFHDMWAITGGCTNSLGCDRWLGGCGHCAQWRGDNRVASMPALSRDSTAWLLKIKKWIYARSSFCVVAPSRWMAGLAQRSPLLGGKSVVHIPNSLDTDFWKPLDKAACKRVLDIDPARKVILFVGKPDKLFFYPGREDMLLRSLASFREQAAYAAGRYVLLLVGEGGQEVTVDGYEVVATRRVASAAMLRICYNAADVLLNPTQFDNLPGIVQESLSCGTPVVASEVGGVPDLVRPLDNGYLTHLQDPRDFAAGLAMTLGEPDEWQRLALNARQGAIREYSAEPVARLMAGLYECLREQRRSPRVDAALRPGLLR